MDLRNGFDIKRYIRSIPDYPKPGIMFRDITTLLSNMHGFRAAVDELAWPFLKGSIDYVAGIEAQEVGLAVQDAPRRVGVELQIVRETPGSDVSGTHRTRGR